MIRRFFSGVVLTLLFLMPIIASGALEEQIPSEQGSDDVSSKIRLVNVQDVGLENDADAQESPLRLSVEQAVLLALENNRDLHVQRFEPVVTRTLEQFERSRFDPEVFSEVTTSKVKEVENSFSSDDQVTTPESETSSHIGLRKQFGTGTELEAIISHDRSIDDEEEEQIARIGLTLTQPLLRNFGTTVNLASVRQAELGTLASIAELHGFCETLIADSEIAYWNYVLAEKKIAIFEESLQIAQQQREEIEVRIEVGLLPEIEVAAARAEEALRVQDLIDSRSQLEKERLQLLRLINLSPDGALVRSLVVTSQPFLEIQPLTNLEARLIRAESSRPELEEARLRQKQNKLETMMTRNGLLPKLELFITLGKTGYADSFTDSFKRLDGETFDLSGGVRLSYMLGNRKAKARSVAAFAARRQADAAFENLRQLVRLDVRLAFIEVERTRLQIAATRVTRNFQQQALAAEKERFEVGSSTALQVAQAQRDLLNSQIAESKAIIDYRIALVRLERAEGRLLGHHGITLADNLRALK